MNITTSPDISVLLVNATWDISGLQPLISLQNLSQGSNLAGCSFWFVATTPTGTIIHQGTQATPDIVGNWTTFVLSDSWPRPWNQIEFSGAPYNLTVFVVDSHGNVFSDNSYNATICRPAGNTPLSKNPYGLSSINLQLFCSQARIYFEDTTINSYQGIIGTQLASVLRVTYPIDPTGNIPTPFVIGNFSVAMVPISYSSTNYQFFQQSVYNYQLAPNVFVNIQYQQIRSFPVLCNIDLMPLLCEYQNLIHSIEAGTCSDVNTAERKLTLINPKLSLVLMGLNQPLLGIDISKLIHEIEKIGGFGCDCCNAPTGIIPTTASVIDGYTFSIVPVCGDVTGTVTASGTNIQFNLQDKSYVFNLSNTIPTTAFTITPSTNGCTKTYTMNVDMVQFGTDLANTILSNSALLNLWQTIAQGNNGNFNLTVDGGCIFSSTATFNYTFTLSNIPSSTTFALQTGLQVGTVVQPLNFSFNLTNLAALQTYLNALGLGTFTVSNPSGQTVLITSNANPNVLTSMTYKISGTTFIAALTSSATGYVPVSANYVIQQIINAFCRLTDEGITTSAQYTICYIDPTTNEPVDVIIPVGTTLASFLSTLTTNECKTIEYVTSLGALTCASISAIFPTSANILRANDFLLGTKQGACARILPIELANAILSAGMGNQTFLNNFCALVELCGAGQPCAPYNTFNALLTPYSNACPSIVNFTYGWNNDVLNITNIAFGNTPGGNQTISVYYRQSGTPSYTLYNSSITVGADGTVLTPISISLSPGLNYDIQLIDNCSSPAAPYVKTVTSPGNTYTVHLTSDAFNVTVTSVNNMTGFTLAAPLTAGGNAYGTHNSFTGAVSLTVTYGSPTPPQVSAIMKVNGTQIDCVNITGNGTFAFGSHTFNLTDFIEIDLQQASC